MSDLDYFMRFAKKHPTLAKEEQLRLARSYAQGDKAAGQRLVNCNLRYVVQRAHHHFKCCTHSITLADLVQEGCVGLLRAVEKFDPSLGYNLITYARSWIDACIKNYIVANFYSIKCGTTHASRILFFKFADVCKIIDMDAAEDKDVARAQLADRINKNSKGRQRISIKDIKEHEGRVCSKEYSIDAISDDGFSWHNHVPDKSPSAQDIVSKSRLKGIIEQALLESSLTLKENKILKDRFLSSEPKTLADIGRELNISRERVRQMQEDALLKLKKSLHRRGITQELV